MGYGENPYGDTGYGIEPDIIAPVVTVLEVSRTKVSDETGYRNSVITWKSDENGDYFVEVGGTGKGTGYLIESGTCLADEENETTVSDQDLEDAEIDRSDGVYKVNVYVSDSSNNTNPYES